MSTTTTCLKYKKRSCSDWNRLELIDFFERLEQPYNEVWTNKKLCQELDKMCKLLGVIPILSPKPKRHMPLVNPALESYVEKISQAQAKDRKQLAKYCQELQKISAGDMRQAYYRDYLIEIDKFVKRIVKHYQIDTRNLKSESDALSIMMNCEYLKNALNRTYS